MNNDIIIAIEILARAVQDEDSTVRVWAAASLASRLGMAAILTANPDRVEAVVEVGELWVLSVAELLEDEPHRQGDTLRAAHAVVQRLLDGVEDEGLANPRRGRLAQDRVGAQS